ncbi:hypothetical protein HP532_12785 [Pseudomonas sp. CrR25]|nr:hypothetical protein [Pseudomonas sp. CrR25]
MALVQYEAGLQVDLGTAAGSPSAAYRGVTARRAEMSTLLAWQKSVGAVSA